VLCLDEIEGASGWGFADERCSWFGATTWGNSPAGRLSREAAGH
jgi:hypothetical protein